MTTEFLDGPTCTGRGSQRRNKSSIGDVFRRGANTGLFSPDLEQELRVTAVSAWAAVHGFTMLVIDGLASVGTFPMPKLFSNILINTLHGRETRA